MCHIFSLLNPVKWSYMEENCPDKMSELTNKNEKGGMVIKLTINYGTRLQIVRNIIM
jgi:hypothetical protein